MGAHSHLLWDADNLCCWRICLARIVMLPRLIVTADPVVAQRADDLLRAVIMNDMHDSSVGTLRNYLWLQWFFFLPWLLSSSILFGTQIVATALVLLCWAPKALQGSPDDGKYLGGRKTRLALEKGSRLVSDLFLLLNHNSLVPPYGQISCNCAH